MFAFLWDDVISNIQKFVKFESSISATFFCNFTHCTLGDGFSVFKFAADIEVEILVFGIGGEKFVLVYDD